MDGPHRIPELMRLFLKLGVLAFGGPAAHIAMMEADVVSRHGRRGLIAAGVCFILPAMLIVWVLAILYVHYQTLPQVNWLLYGVKPVILAVIVQALWRLGRTATKNIPTGTVGAVAAILALIGWHPLLLLAIAGLGLMIVNNSSRHIQRHRLSSIVPFNSNSTADLSDLTRHHSSQYNLVAHVLAFFSRSDRCSMAVATSYWRSCRTIWSSTGSGSRRHNCSTPSQSAKSPQDRYLPPPPLSATYWRDMPAHC